MTSAEVITDDEGQAVLVKRAEDEPARTRLAHEAKVLRRVRHPGVVELLRTDLDDRDPTITLAWVSARTAGQLGILPPELAAGLVVEVARTVADLHRLKVVHGRLTPDHVLVREDGHPVICGWSGATLGEGATEPEAAGSARLAQSKDVAALGALLRLLVGQTQLEPIPDRRSRWRRGSTDTRAALLTLADVASHEEVHRRPTALAFIADVLAVVPGASLPRPAPDPLGAPTPAPPADPWAQVPDAPATDDPNSTLRRRQLGAAALSRPAPRRSWAPARRVVVGIGLATALGFLGVGLAHTSGHSVAAPVHTSVPARASRTTTATTVTPSTTTSMTTAPECPSPPGPDVDGDGCPDSLTIAGGVVTTASHRYVVGSPDDQIVVADWDCDGVATPALLRHRTGEVFVFPDWASPSHPVTVPATATVRHDTVIAASDTDHDGCSDLIATSAGAKARILARSRRR